MSLPISRQSSLATSAGDPLERHFERATSMGSSSSSVAAVGASAAVSPGRSLAALRTKEAGRHAYQFFDSKDARVKEDILRMIAQYLQDEGYAATKTVLQDEARVKLDEQVHVSGKVKRLRSAIYEGEWGEVEKLCTKQVLKNARIFLYAVYKQQFLEHLDRRAYQKAFSLLTRRIKPLEGLAPPDEYKDMCYLLTCGAITDAQSFRDWEGVGPAREKLVAQLNSMLELESLRDGGAPGERVVMPPQRLLTLLQQSAAYQVEFGRYHPKVAPKIETLLRDYQCFVLPNQCRSVARGHRANVKCVAFAGEAGTRLLSGSSDNTVKVWDSNTGRCYGTLTGHSSRIWSVCGNRLGDHAVSASADGTVKIWDIQQLLAAVPSSSSPDAARESGAGAGAGVAAGTAASTAATPHAAGASGDGGGGGGGEDAGNDGWLCTATLACHSGDVYSVQYHPGENHLTSGGYDKQICLSDIRVGTTVRRFGGHELSVTDVVHNPHGNLIVSGSKDQTVRFWDVMSGLCIKTIAHDLGEVTSVEMDDSGMFLLIATKDNSNRLWDVRMQRPMRRFRGHQNSNKNFVRASFGPTDRMICSGSESGTVHLWDRTTGESLQRLSGHGGVVYGTVWNAQQALLASCADDGTVRTWWFDESQPLFQEDDD